MMKTAHALITALVLNYGCLHAAEKDPSALLEAASLMTNQQWSLAYELFNAVDEQQLASEESYGKVLFSMGLCQMKLAQSDENGQEHYQLALEAFTRCHHWQAVEGKLNLYKQRSLLRIGMCHQAMGNLEKSEVYYDQFLLKKNQVYDRYDHGNLLLNLAHCSALKKTPDRKKAEEMLRLAYNGRDRYKLSKRELAEALLTIYDRLPRDRSAALRQMCLQYLTELSALQSSQTSDLVSRVGSSVALALKKKDQERAFEILEIFPWIREWKQAHGEGRKFLFKMAKDRSAEVIESFVWLARIYGDGSSEAYSVYTFLLETFEESDQAQEWSYHNILFDLKAGHKNHFVQSVEKFKTKFPSSQYLAEIQLLEMGFLFDSEAYEQVSSLAKANLADLEIDGNIRETSLYLLTVSSSFLGSYENSIQYAKLYLREFSGGKFLNQVHYFEAVSLARMGLQKMAREKLEGVANEQGEMRDVARFELAVLDVEFALYQNARTKLKQLVASELENSLKAQVDLMLARVSAILRDREVAERHYLKALKIARENNFPKLEQETLFYLVAFYGREEIAGEANTEITKSIPYYDAFFEKFEDSVYANQVAAIAMPALKIVGQSEKGIKRLEKCLKAACSQMREPGMQEVASALVWARLGSGEKLRTLRAKTVGGDTFAQVMRFALAEVYSAGSDQSKAGWGRSLGFDALKRAMYAEISLVKDQSALPSYIQFALGDWLLAEDFFPDLALRRFALPVGLSSQKHVATLGRAKSLRLIGGEGNLVKALDLLVNLVNQSKSDPDLNKKVRYELIETHVATESWDILTEQCRRYLIDDKIVYQRARVSYLLALSYDKRGLIEDAIVNYSRVFTSSTRLLPVSAPTVDRLIDLTWSRNSPASGDHSSDRQSAYQLGHRYLTLIEDYPKWEKSVSKVAPHLSNIKKQVALWEASGEVTSVKQLLKELRQGKR